jgi:hypothetical protein
MYIAFNNIKLNEYDDVRVALVKLALDGHFHAVRYYSVHKCSYNFQSILIGKIT